jgi:hypothetical protein
MALIECEECGKQISDKAPQCIQCGAPIEKTSITPKTEDIGTHAEALDDSVQSFLSLHPESRASHERRKAKIISCKSETGGGTIQDIETQAMMSYSGFEVSDGKLLSGHEGSIIEYERRSGRLFLIAPENTFENQFVKKSDRIQPTQPASVSSQFNFSSGGEDQNKISKNYLWYLMVIILFGGFWFSKGTPSPALFFAGSSAKKECLKLANKNKGSMMILSNADIRANNTWLKDGKRVVQLLQENDDKIREIICIYGNGMVQIPSMFEQNRWR